MAESALIQTGIAGLDALLRGGVPQGNVILVEGAAGTSLVWSLSTAVSPTSRSQASL